METEKQKPAPKWGALGYEQVPGLTNRIISRYLRGQRRNMERFFTERGLYDLVDRMDRIRKMNKGMMAKNKLFQGVLDEYAARRTAPPAVAQAADHQGEGTASVVLPGDGVPNTVGDAADPVRDDRSDAGAGVPTVAGEDADVTVIEE
jgi:hypothetical protein